MAAPWRRHGRGHRGASSPPLVERGAGLGEGGVAASGARSAHATTSDLNVNGAAASKATVEPVRAAWVRATTHQQRIIGVRDWYGIEGLGAAGDLQ